MTADIESLQSRQCGQTTTNTQEMAQSIATKSRQLKRKQTKRSVERKAGSNQSRACFNHLIMYSKISKLINITRTKTMRTAIALDGSEYETDAPEVVEVIELESYIQDNDLDNCRELLNKDRKTMYIFKWKMQIPEDRHGHTKSTGTCKSVSKDLTKVRQLIFEMRNNAPCYPNTLEIELQK